MAPPNTMRMGNVEIIYKLLEGLKYSYLSLTRPESISVLSPLYWIFYIVSISARLDMTFILWDAYHHLVWWVGCYGYSCSENINAAGSCQNISSTYPTFRVVQTQGIQTGLQCHLVRILDKEISGTLEDSHVLYVFLLNTSLHIDQV